jgi:hypothetical protein
MKIILVGLIVLVINAPFGYWRANVKRFSLQWFLAIHIPVLFVIALRLAFHLGFAWYTYVVLVSAFFLGQQFGSLIIKRMSRIGKNVTSCLVMDLLRSHLH